MGLGEAESSRWVEVWSFSCTGVELGGQHLIQSYILCLNLVEGSMSTRLRRDYDAKGWKEHTAGPHM